MSDGREEREEILRRIEQQKQENRARPEDDADSDVVEWEPERDDS